LLNGYHFTIIDLTIMFFSPILSIGKRHLRNPQGGDLSQPLRWMLVNIISLVLAAAIALFPLSLKAQTKNSTGQVNPNLGLGIKSKRVEANSNTGVVTFIGNVQINYPARKIQGTAAQAQYYSRERRLVLSGNVYVLQEGNSMQAETMTYLIDEGHFIATPKSNQQVESIYLIPDNPSSTNSNAAPQIPQFNPNSREKSNNS
jgi:lipopolysaccharide export system protein LptA